MTLLVDNYDSFTFNLFQIISAAGETCKVIRNDKITLQEIEDLKPQNIVLSPGPGTPDAAGITLDVINQFSNRIPILGVCLGHQALAQAFGGEVRRAKTPRHGEISSIYHDQKGLFKNLPNPLKATRYHSLEVNKNNLPLCLEVTSQSEDGVVMGLRHKIYPLEGLQFHPESVATQCGEQMIHRFLGKNGGGKYD